MGVVKIYGETGVKVIMKASKLSKSGNEDWIVYDENNNEICYIASYEEVYYEKDENIK